MHKNPNVNLGSSPARPASFAKSGDIDIAPGQYNHEMQFGEDTKSFKIGEKRDPKTQKSVGPGEYDPTHADRLTKQKIPNVHLGQAQARPASFAKSGDVNVAPGQYDHEKRFGDDTKSFKIGEKRDSRISETVGPGSYYPDRGDKYTRSKSPEVRLGSSQARPTTFAKHDNEMDVAPGQYDDYSRNMGNNGRGFTIGEKRESRVQQTPGPGEYNPEKSEGKIRNKSPSFNMGSTSPSRPHSFAKHDHEMDVAPGQYDDASY